MQEVVKFLNENSTGFLATVDKGKPRVRPFGFMLEDDGRFFFCTANTKNVYQQLKENPFVEFSSATPECVWLRLSGEVKFSNDLTIKGKIIEKNALVKSIYQTADNPIFEIFYLEHGTAIMADFSGQPPRVVEF